MTSCFSSYGTADNRVVGHFRHHGKIQQCVVLHHRFSCFMNPNRHRFFSKGMIVVVLTTKSLLVNTITHCLPYAGSLVHHH